MERQRVCSTKARDPNSGIPGGSKVAQPNGLEGNPITLSRRILGKIGRPDLTSKKRTMLQVFVVGSSRSGTTLLNSLLSTSARFASFHAEAQLATFCQQKYGAISGRRRLDRFLADWTTSRPFLRSGLASEEFEHLAATHLPDWYGLTEAFLNAVAVRQEKAAWVESTPAHVFHLIPLARRLPNARFVHAVRDGRSVAASRRKLGWTVISTPDPLLQLVYAGLSWSQSIRAAERAQSELDERMITVRYEALITDPAAVLERLNAHLFPGEAPGPLTMGNLNSLAPGNSAFGTLQAGLDQSPKDRWRHDLSAFEAELLTWYLAPELSRLGYLHCRPPAAPRRYHLLRAACHAHLSCRMWIARSTPLGRLTRALPERDE